MTNYYIALAIMMSFGIISIMIVIILDKKIKKEKRLDNDKSVTAMFEANGFQMIQENSQTLFEKSHLKTFFDKNEYNQYGSISSFEKDNLKVTQLYFDISQAGHKDRISGEFFTKPIKAMITKPLLFYFDEDSLKPGYYIDYEPWPSNVMCEMEMDVEKTDFDVNIDELKYSYVSADEAEFKRECANLANKTELKFDFLCYENHLEVFFDHSYDIEYIEANKDLFVNLTEEETQNMIFKDKIRIVEDIEKVLNVSKIHE